MWWFQVCRGQVSETEVGCKQGSKLGRLEPREVRGALIFQTTMELVVACHCPTEFCDVADYVEIIGDSIMTQLSHIR